MNIAEINRELSDLYKIKVTRIFFELILYSLLAWTFFISSLFYPNIGLIFLSGIFFYKGLSFLHEVSHLEKIYPQLKTIYNILLGIPNRIPAYTMRTHKYHHGVKTFGKITDPEYENWTKKSKLSLMRPLVLSPFYPLVLILRFGLWPFVLLILPERFSLKTFESFSSFVMNLKFRRPFGLTDYKEFKSHDLYCALFFIVSSLILYMNSLLSVYLINWSLMVIGIYIVNTSRALVAHRYMVDQNPNPNKQIEQLIDSVTIEGRFITPLWAPIGLQFHSTHHLLPRLPYYSLRAAHKRLLNILPKDHEYFKTIEPGFFSAYKKLVISCRG